MQSGVAAAGIALHRRNNTWPGLVSRFVTLSRFATAKLAQAGIPERQVTVGSNFVTDPGPRRRPPSESDEVLFVGRLSREKGVSDLLAAWAIAEVRGLRLRVIGDGPERADLEAAAPRSVRFTGTLSPDLVRRKIAEARAVVVPSVWYEGQPIVALEALSSGTPLVLSRVGGLPEVLGRRDAGWLCSPGDRAGLAAVLEDLHDADEVDRRGRVARERYEETFTRSSALSRLEDLYEAVVTA